MSCGIRKLPIAGLSPDVNNALIVAVLIAKRNFKLFTSKKDSEERGVWNFTLRDSHADTINAALWGSSEFVQNMYQVFNTGDVVEIIYPRIMFKQPGAMDNIFSPAVTSPFQLQLQENKSNMLIYAEDDAECFRELIFIPTKSPEDFLKLSDIFSYGQAMRGEFVNLLVAIRNVGEVRNVKSRKGSKDLICRHITVMDDSHLEFHITLWDEEIIRRSDNWRPRETIIFFADVKLDWDQFRSASTAVITQRTVVTENPRTNEAEALRSYARKAPIQPSAVLEYLAHNLIDANSINTVMTTGQVLDKSFNGTGTSQFTALVYGILTHLNLDGSEAVTVYKCSKCSQVLDEEKNCLNTDCLISGKRFLDHPTVSFQLRVHVTDHQGTLSNCSLTSPVADKVFGCSAQRYLEMCSEEKTRLKWSLLLNRCEVRIVVLTTSPERPQPLISIVSCKPTKLSAMASKLPLY